MKNSILFKSLIDILFFLHVLGLFAIIFQIPINIIGVANRDPLKLMEWVMLIINGIIYIIFLRGLFFLRKIAREFLRNKLFTNSVINSMKISGNQFAYAGLMLLLLLISKRIFDLNFEFIPDTISITPIFLIAVGLFFTIQSKVLQGAVIIKDENNLTI